MCSRINSTQLERWFGKEWIEQVSQSMQGWYGTPLPILSTGGRIYVDGDGCFLGSLRAGRFYSLLDYIEDRANFLFKRMRRLSRSQLATAQMAGFAGLADFIEGFKANRQVFHFNKTIASAAANSQSCLFRLGALPIAGSAAAAAPGGTVYTSSSTGAVTLVNPTAGERMYYSGGVFKKPTSTVAHTMLMFDKLYGASIAMSNSSSQSITGVPTRYQNFSSTAEDSVVNNFLYIDVTSTLSNTAHTWTATYINENETSATIPTLTGTVSLPATRLDHPAGQWFVPLERGSRGIQSLTAAQCSSPALTGGIEFSIGHAIGWMPFVSILHTIMDGLIGGLQLARIFDDACLTFLAISTPNSTATMQGYINIVTR